MSSIKAVGDPNWPEKFRERKDNFRFFYIDHVEKSRAGANEYGEKWIKFFKILSKVIEVVGALIAISVPLTVGYLPIWVPLGIGAPLSIILAIVRYKVESKIGDFQSDTTYMPHLEAFLKNGSLRALHPKGVADLPPIDERLKSDKLIQRQQPGSCHRIEKLASIRSGGKYALDLELSPFLQKMAAAECANKAEHLQRWEEIRNQRALLRAQTDRCDLEKSQEEAEKLTALAYGSINSSLKPAPKAEFPQTTEEMYLQSLAQLYRSLMRHAKELVKLHQVGFDLYKESHPLWEPYQKKREMIREARKQLEADPSLATKNDETLLQYALNEAKMIKRAFQLWIKAHPERRYELLKERLEGYEKNEVPSQQCLKLLSEWILKHSEDAKLPIHKILEQLPKEVQSWLVGHTRCQMKTPMEFYDWAFELRTHFTAAQAAFSRLEKKGEAITEFETLSMKPLREMVAAVPSTFFGKIKTAFTMMPAIPFEKEAALPKEGTPLRQRRMEEIRLNRMLEETDRDMVRLYRINRIALTIVNQILLPILALVLYYVTISNLWEYWTLSGLTAATLVANYFIDRKLQELDRRKQMIMMQHHLRDSPDVGVVPATHPKVAALKEVQQRYGLEGIRPTWARLLVEDPDAPTEPIQKLAKEGSKEAASYLEDSLIGLYTKMFRARGQERNKIKQTIREIETTLHPKEEKKVVPAGVKVTKWRPKLENYLDQMTDFTLQELQDQAKIRYLIAIFQELAKILPAHLLDSVTSLEEKVAYLATVDPADQPRHLKALEKLMMLQSDAEWATPALVEDKKADHEAVMGAIDKKREEYLTLYTDHFKPPSNEMIDRAIQKIDQQLDAVLEKLSYQEKWKAAFEKARDQFKALTIKLSAEVVEEPVSQKEIDHLLKTAATDDNLEAAKALRQLQTLQNDPDFKSQGAVEKSLEKCLIEIEALEALKKVLIECIQRLSEKRVKK